MQIKFLGTGGAFDYDLGNSAAIVTLNEKNILVDCGNSVYRKLRECKLASHIDYILITHFHDDHVGSLNSTILHHKYFSDPSRPAKILIPAPEFQDLLGWFISFGMPHPERYVDFIPLEEVPGIKAIDTFGMHIQNMQSYAYLFEDEGEVLAYSGDLGDPDIVFEHLKDVKGKNIRVFHEMSFKQTEGVHAYYKDLEKYVSKYDIFAYHMDHRKEPTDNKVPLVANFPDLIAYPPSSVE